MASNNYIAIPLRGEHCVFLEGIPWDFTDEEALKVAAIIEALAEEPPPEPQPNPTVSGDGSRLARLFCGVGLCWGGDEAGHV